MRSAEKAHSKQSRDFAKRRVYARLVSYAALCVIACLALSLAACNDNGTVLQQDLPNPVGNTATESVIPEGTAPEITTQVQTAGNQTTGDPSNEPQVQIATQPATPPNPQPDPQDETATGAEPVTPPAAHHANHATIRFTDSSTDIWPPQPADITDVAEIPAADFARPNREPFTNLDAYPNIANLLGERYEVLASHTIRNKSDMVTHIETEIFAYDTDQVVTVKLSADGSTVIGHRVAFAYQYQPPESKSEVQQAIALAMHALSAQGFSDHLTLNGTGLLAYPTATETAATGHQFFSQRKIYVTFGTGNGELPQYRALVNLSNAAVESSGAMQ